jgi:phospholipid-binding lipoprotein MlaA
MKSKNINTVPRRVGTVMALAASAMLAGCATPGNPQDPLEKFNRASFAFNDTVDRVALKPAATAYRKVLPSFAQTGVSNFFGNLSDAWSSVNNLLQGKGEAGMSDLTRVALNSTFGLAGLLDIASEAGLPKHNEDFGQTLGVWGVPAGPFVMLPILGPSTLRDTAALPADFAGDIWAYKTPVDLRNVGIVTRVVDKRAALLDASNLFEDAALDRYDFIRDGYMQRRESQVRDGESQRSDDPQDEAPAPAKEAPAPGQAPAAAPATAPAAAPAPNTQVVADPAASTNPVRK